MQLGNQGFRRGDARATFRLLCHLVLSELHETDNIFPVAPDPCENEVRTQLQRPSFSRARDRK